jgi:RNA polymerase sigma-70 factor (ECF subfamily)
MVTLSRTDNGKQSRTTVRQASSDVIEIQAYNKPIRTETATDCITCKDVIEKYKDTVLGIALSYTRNYADADDVSQDVFLSYFDNHTKITFNSEEHRKAWLIRVTVNRCKKSVMSFWKKKTVPLIEGEYGDRCTAGDFRFAFEEENAIFNAMGSLPEKYRTALHLHYFEDLTVAQISEILKIKQNTILSHLKRGRELMKVKLQQDYFY